MRLHAAVAILVSGILVVVLCSSRAVCNLCLYLQVKQVLDGWIKPGIAAAAASQQPTRTTCTTTDPVKKPLSTSDILDDVPDLDTVSVATSCAVWKLGSCMEYYLPAEVCQSRILGRNGSTACTVIAALVVKSILSGK